MIGALHPVLIQEFTAIDLQSLFQAFDILEKGISVRLLPLGLESQNTMAGPSPTSAGPLLGLYSSGSTGEPKLFWQPWSQLKSELRLHPASSGWTWASPFSPSSFAGVQVALQAWAGDGQVLSLGSDWVANWDLLADKKVPALSCTPTFLDLILRSPSSARRWAPSQITLGGEPLRPAAGARFQKVFSHTRFTVIYASAESGVLLKTHRLDGWYEVGSLEKRVRAWRIQHGELHLFKNGSWLSTGDLVEREEALLRIVGRADRVANVAGSKINLDEVSRAAEELPGIRVAFAFAEPNPVSGEIVALRFLPENGSAVEELQCRLEEYLRQRLPKESWPRRWEIGETDLGPNAKRAFKRRVASREAEPVVERPRYLSSGLPREPLR